MRQGGGAEQQGGPGGGEKKLGFHLIILRVRTDGVGARVFLAKRAAVAPRVSWALFYARGPYPRWGDPVPNLTRL